MVKVNIHEHYTRVTRFSPLLACKHRGGSRGRGQGVRTMWFIGVEVEQETSAPPPKKNPGSAPETDR